jgi:hypothetical protein
MHHDRETAGSSPVIGSVQLSWSRGLLFEPHYWQHTALMIERPLVPAPSLAACSSHDRVDAGLDALMIERTLVQTPSMAACSSHDQEDAVLNPVIALAACRLRPE